MSRNLRSRKKLRNAVSSSSTMRPTVVQREPPQRRNVARIGRVADFEDEIGPERA